MAIYSGSNHMPLYYQLKHEIIDKIQSGEYKANLQLPTESELCEMYGVSKAPVRQALRELALENYIYTIRGKGSFVLSGYIKQKAGRLRSFSDEIREMGYEPGSVFIDRRMVKPDMEIAKNLGIDNEEEVLEIIRLRLISGEVYSLNYSYYSLEQYPQLENIRFESPSLTEEYNRVLRGEMTFATVTLEATGMTEEMSESLQREVGSPLLKLSRITYYRINQLEKPLEFSRIYFVPEKYKFEVNLYNK